MKKFLAILLALAMVLSLAACGKSEAAQAADDMIAAIGTVTLQLQGRQQKEQRQCWLGVEFELQAILRCKHILLLKCHVFLVRFALRVRVDKHLFLKYQQL